MLLYVRRTPWSQSTVPAPSNHAGQFNLRDYPGTSGPETSMRHACLHVRISIQDGIKPWRHDLSGFTHAFAGDAQIGITDVN